MINLSNWRRGIANILGSSYSIVGVTLGNGGFHFYCLRRIISTILDAGLEIAYCRDSVSSFSRAVVVSASQSAVVLAPSTSPFCGRLGRPGRQLGARPPCVWSAVDFLDELGIFFAVAAALNWKGP